MWPHQWRLAAYDCRCEHIYINAIFFQTAEATEYPSMIKKQSAMIKGYTFPKMSTHSFVLLVLFIHINLMNL